MTVIMFKAVEEAIEVDGVAAGVADGDSVCMATGREFTEEASEIF